MKKTLLLLAAALASTALHADVPAVLTLKSGGELKGMARWQPAKKQYAVTVKQGQLETLQEVPATDVAGIRVQPPQALQQAAQTRNAAALEKIVKEYTMLQFDVVAGNAAAKIYLAQGKNADALRVCNEVIRGNPAAAKGELAPVYWKAKMANGQGADLAPLIDEAIQKGSPDAAATALILRGDLLRADNKLQDALTEGYLRVIAFHRAQRDAVAEALAKATDTFEQLQQPQYAQKMRTELITRYPDSPEAKKLRGQ